MISVLILTHNEEANIADCLQSVCWADDVLVIDSGSTDRTVEIAQEWGARVMHRPFDSFANQRNYGLREGKLAHDWVLHLDADERVTEVLHEEMMTAVKRSDKRAFRIPSKLMFRGQWLKYSGMYPTYQIRLGRRDALTFRQVGHGQRGELPDDDVGTLDAPLIHYAFSKGIADWIERHNRYSTDEARRMVAARSEQLPWRDLLSKNPQKRRRAVKELSYRLPLRPLWRFVYMYVLRLGFLDGRAGLTYCTMIAMYEYMVELKLKHLSDKEERNECRTRASDSHRRVSKSSVSFDP